MEHTCFSEADRIIRGKRGIQSVLYIEWNWSVMMIKKKAISLNKPEYMLLNGAASPTLRTVPVY